VSVCARPALTGALGNCVKESVPVSPEGRLKLGSEIYIYHQMIVD
jgi:hypothetical protein